MGFRRTNSSESKDKVSVEGSRKKCWLNKPGAGACLFVFEPCEVDAFPAQHCDQLRRSICPARPVAQSSRPIGASPAPKTHSEAYRRHAHRRPPQDSMSYHRIFTSSAIIEAIQQPTLTLRMPLSTRCLARPLRAARSLRLLPCSPTCRSLSSHTAQHQASPASAPEPSTPGTNKDPKPKKLKPLTEQQRQYLSSAVSIPINICPGGGEK